MDTRQSTPGFTSEASLSGNLPHTPPYTPQRAKRRFQRAESPASIKSLHPAETSSPAKKVHKRSAEDNIKVEELTEGDVGYMTDIDLVYPEELEEAESASDEEHPSSSDNHESDDGIVRHFSRLGCEDTTVEAAFEKKRRQKHLKKRKNSRVFKRSHSQSAKGDSEATDPDAMGDHDLDASTRRLRRRVRGPEGTKVGFDDIPRSSVEPEGLAPSAPIRERWQPLHSSGSGMDDGATDDAMDVDG